MREEAIVSGLVRKALGRYRGLTVSQFADEERWMPLGSSPEPGRWRTDRVPFAREIMDSLGVSWPGNEVVFMKSSQVGATEVGNNWVLDTIAEEQTNMLFCSGTVDLAWEAKGIRIEPAIEDCPIAKGLIYRSVEDRIQFYGGMVKFIGAQSATAMRSTSARKAFGDEVSTWPRNLRGEGDPVELLKRAMRTYDDYKLFLASTPSRVGQCRIVDLYEDSDQRVYEVPCPECGGRQELLWGQLVWEEGQPATVRYQCTHCETHLRWTALPQMLRRGEWVPRNAGHPVRGYRINSLYSPWFSWERAVSQFENIREDPEKEQVFCNTILGEAWRPRSVAPDYSLLADKSEPWEEGVVPPGVVVITCGVDVQRSNGGWLALEVVGWGPGMESWSIEYREIRGATGSPLVGAWVELQRFISAGLKDTQGRKRQISMTAVDCGDQTRVVYEWVMRQGNDRVRACRGSARREGQAVRGPIFVTQDASGGKLRTGERYYSVATDMGKEQVYTRLSAEDVGRCHFPRRSESFWRGLVSEEYTVAKATRSGIKRGHWHVIPGRERNEPLDCRVLNWAASIMLGLHTWSDDQWELQRELLNGVPMETKAERESVASVFVHGEEDELYPG